MQIKNVSTVINTAKNFITANSPVLLVAGAVTGVVTTGVLSARAGYKARGIVEEAEAEKGEPLTKQEKVQLTWLCYTAPVITGGTTIASCVGVHTIHTKRHAALAGLYAVASTKLEDYQDKAEELLGVKKTQQLNNEVAAKTLERHPLFDDSEVIITNGGDELCYDEWSGRYFMGSMPAIESAVNEVNRLINEGGSASLNDFYEYVGLGSIPAGITHGWSGEHIRPSFGTTQAKDGRVALTVYFHKPPKEGYDNHR